jgi:hypothetical protein
MALKDELFAIEEGFWTGGEDYGRTHSDGDCPAELSERWRNIETEDRAFLRPLEDLAMIAYQARATRASGQPYSAKVSTGYVRRGDIWKLAFHSQTPLICSHG